MNIKVKCPTCSKNIAWTPQERWRPFCSQRCKMLDLGDWFDESNKLGEQPSGGLSEGQPWLQDGAQPRNDDEF